MCVEANKWNWVFAHNRIVCLCCLSRIMMKFACLHWWFPLFFCSSSRLIIFACSHMIASYALLSVKSLYNRLSPPPLHPPPLSARHTNIPYGQQHKMYLHSNALFSFVQIHFVLNVFKSCYLNKLFCKFWIYFSKYYRLLGSWSALDINIGPKIVILANVMNQKIVIFNIFMNEGVR